MSSHIVTPGPYRATKLWNEITRLFRAGMPLKKHRQNLRNYSSCFTAVAAVDWLHQMLCSNSNFGPDVTRQQTVQLLKKFLKNHVIEDVKGRWGTEELEDNNTLYRFPSTSPLKPIPYPAVPSASKGIKKRPSLRDKEGFFRFKSMKKNEQETEENRQAEEERDPGEPQVQRRELTGDDELNIWRDTTLTHLQKILGVASLDEVLDHRSINPHNIIHNMNKVNKHGVVTLDDKTNDLPHWVLSAMKSLANWPKYDSAQLSYPGFERDVFKTVSDYFYSLPQPLLTYELYELFINVLVYCGYVAAPTAYQGGKRKTPDLPSAPPPAKTSFRSTECLLLSLLRQGTCDETESPMSEVLGGKVQSHLAVLRGAPASTDDGQLGGSYMSLSTAGSLRRQTRSCSLETVLYDSTLLTRQQIFLSNDSLASCFPSSRSQDSNSRTASTKTSVQSVSAPHSFARHSVDSVAARSAPQRVHTLPPRSVGSCLDIVVETKEESFKETKWEGRAASCLHVNPSEDQHHSHVATPPLLSCSQPHASFSSPPATKAHSPDTTSEPSGPRLASSTSNLWTLPAPAVVRRCLSSLDVSKLPRPTSLFKPSVCVPTARTQHPEPKSEHRLFQPQSERVAIDALQLCTLLLPPASRRKLQLLMRMMSRISQNVDMPRLHPAIGTRTMMVHTFSGCVLASAEECELDELLATRLVSFLMDHQQRILSVPEYLVGAINDHVQYLRTAQVPIDDVANVVSGNPVYAPLPMYTFCCQISGAEFEQQKLSCSQKAMEDLLEMILTDQNMTEKDRRKKLKQFQKQYPDIYSRQFPSTEKANKPKIKAPLLIRKTKAFSIRN
ncbi:DEP domain-containing protein 1A isoform X2 [Phyllopteryx taeniolatus]|uniref:DEP domain-containing protein 1A isoform X2 n=1 Tax=Phyllopteryx taeniolatus TaxID=161469 RepID=UPI002AD4ED0E|nr:DEP domain-containing protein 1A isoform X2 [Phyllopteryx taeniolatus]